MDRPAVVYSLLAVGALLVVLALIVIFLNYTVVFAYFRNKRQGITKHSSMIFVLPQVLLLLAYAALRHLPHASLSGWALLSIALLDPGIWTILSLPIFLLRRKR